MTVLLEECVLEATVEEVEDLGLYEWWLVVSGCRRSHSRRPSLAWVFRGGTMMLRELVEQGTSGWHLLSWAAVLAARRCPLAA